MNQALISEQNHINDRISGPDGRIIYPCQYCSKVFYISTSREMHLTKCQSKTGTIFNPKITTPPHNQNIIIQQNIPLRRRQPPRIEVKQNIILGEKLNVREVLNGSSTLKFTIRRSPVKEGGQFTISHNGGDTTILNNIDLNLKELEEIEESTSSEDDDDDDEDFNLPDENRAEISTPFDCKQCDDKFMNRLQLLRHSRVIHKYRKVKMALSEIKKFYSIEDMTKCPICSRPLKSGYRSAYLKHLHTHTNELYHCCKVCKRKFRRIDHMKTHEKRHVIEDFPKDEVKN